MRIDGVYLRGVGPFAEARLDFQPRQSVDKADLHILVGPNGSGKSTILYALAAALAGAGDDLGAAHALRRMPREDSLFAVSADGAAVAFARGTHNSEHARVEDPFFGGVMLRQGTFGVNDSLLVSPRPNAPPIQSYHGAASKYLKASVDTPAMDFAAFAYSGSRSLFEPGISAIEEPTDGPLAQSLSFDKSVDARRLSQWLSATFARRALANERRNADEAERFGSSIERIEEAVGDVIGGPIRLNIDYHPRFRIIVERHGKTIDLDVLPDGLKSILSWLADLLMRLDRIAWQGDTPALERPILLLLDEIDVHLHPEWQRKILPMVQRLLPRAQIFVTTHSPFVVSSVSDAWVYPLGLDENGEAKSLPPVKSQAGTSFRAVVKSIFGVEEEFDEDTEAGFRDFYDLRKRILAGETDRFPDLRALGARLSERGIEVRDIVSSEVLRVGRRLEQRT